ncbi:MAG: STAS domain-containing protein [Kiritimatiellae bacterium]|nr:STAS domain-containing protein [Kiritimatiellia bacterium]
MQLSQTKIKEGLVVKAVGRLDASWADLFMEGMLQEVRAGEHHLFIDASELTYVSSAGIRSLILLQKELFTVQGWFRIIHAVGMVRQTLALAGFEQWLLEKAPGKEEPCVREAVTDKPACFNLQWDAALSARAISAWNPWNPVRMDQCRKLVVDEQSFALGIGSAADTLDQSRELFGEFMAIQGCVAMQPPDEHSRPDYLVPEKSFLPELHSIQAILCRGAMSHLLRFSPRTEQPVHSLSTLITEAMRVTEASAIGFVIAGEIEGLVGASLLRSPGRITPETSTDFPAMRDWVNFCGERMFSGEQALICGTALRNEQYHPQQGALLPLAEPGLFAHLHAAVFPYQPLPNGRIELAATVRRFFNGPPPRAVLHLLNDSRPGVGLGESALLRGACWCAPLSNPEVL